MIPGNRAARMSPLGAAVYKKAWEEHPGKVEKQKAAYAGGAMCQVGQTLYEVSPARSEPYSARGLLP